MAERKQQLDTKVAVVAGATRGAGRGIARGLAEAGFMVYCTGRSTVGQSSPYNRRETIDETVAMIIARGGRAVAVRIDHTMEPEVEELFRRIEREHGRVDVVVDSVAGEDPLMGRYDFFWKVDLTHADTVFRQSFLSHIITAKHAALMMIRQRNGLIVEVTESDILMAGGNPLAKFVKLGLKGFALNMAAELKPYGVAATAITPGFLRSERMLEHFKVSESNWRDGGKKDKNFLESESPLFVGRAVAALAQDPHVLNKTGQLCSSWELAREYGFTDDDGRRPDWGAVNIDFSKHPDFLREYLKTGCELQIEWLKTVEQRTRHLLAEVSKNSSTTAS